MRHQGDPFLGGVIVHRADPQAVRARQHGPRVSSILVCHLYSTSAKHAAVCSNWAEWADDRQASDLLTEALSVIQVGWE
jgi:hypothetical protein